MEVCSTYVKSFTLTYIVVGFLWFDNGTKFEYFRSVLFEMNTNTN